MMVRDEDLAPHWTASAAPAPQSAAVPSPHHYDLTARRARAAPHAVTIAT